MSPVGVPLSSGSQPCHPDRRPPTPLSWGQHQGVLPNLLGLLCSHPLPPFPPMKTGPSPAVLWILSLAAKTCPLLLRIILHSPRFPFSGHKLLQACLRHPHKASIRALSFACVSEEASTLTALSFQPTFLPLLKLFFS